MAQDDRSFEEFFEQNRRALAEQLRELDETMEKLRVSRASIQARLEKLNAAKRLLESAPASVEPMPRVTIKQAVVKILETVPHGLTAIGILERLKADFNLNYERTSLSPQLSRLKQDGKIKLDGGVWSLTK